MIMPMIRASPQLSLLKLMGIKHAYLDNRNSSEIDSGVCCLEFKRNAILQNQDKKLHLLKGTHYYKCETEKQKDTQTHRQTDRQTHIGKLQPMENIVQEACYVKTPT